MAPEKVSVSDSERYSIFHSLRLDAKISETIEKEVRRLAGPPAYIIPHGNLPPGTVSEIIKYKVKINGWYIVKAHQYRLPDGSIQGGPDPKYICLDDVVFVSPPKLGRS